MKILFLHGLDSQPYQDRIDVLSKYGEVDMPKIDYREEHELYDKFLQRIQEQQYDIIIGHSLGGLLAYNLSRATQLKCLIFMPAFSSQYYHLLGIPEDVVYPMLYIETLAIISKDDQVVDNEATRQIIPADQIIEIEVISDRSHSLPPPILDKYFRIFMKIPDESEISNEMIITLKDFKMINERK